MRKDIEDIIDQTRFDSTIDDACKEFVKTMPTTDVARTISFSPTSERLFMKCVERALQRRLNNGVNAVSFLESDREFLAAENAKRADLQEKAKALAAQRVADAEKERVEKELR